MQTDWGLYGSFANFHRKFFRLLLIVLDALSTWTAVT